MTYEEAKATIMLEYCEADCCGVCENCELGKAVEALAKQIPMAVATHTIFNDYLQAWERIRVCPVCGVDTPVPRALEIWEWWCPDCGQRLNWRDEGGREIDWSSKPKGNDCDFMFIDEVIAYDTQKND